MAMLEMLTGIKTEYVFRNMGGQNPVVQPSGKGDASEYEQDWTSSDKFSTFQDWMLGPEKHTKPTPNWNPTVIFSRDGEVRALKPAPETLPGDSFVHVRLQDRKRITWPYYVLNSASPGRAELAGSGTYDWEKTYEEIWSDTDTVGMVWITRLKISHDNMAPLSAAPKRVGDEISESGYFKLDDSIIVGL